MLGQKTAGAYSEGSTPTKSATIPPSARNGPNAIACLRAAEPRKSKRPIAASAPATEATRMAVVTAQPSIAPSSRASLKSPIPIAPGMRIVGRKRNRAAPKAATVHSAACPGEMARWAMSTIANVGRTITFGSRRSWRSMIETSTSTVTKRAPRNAFDDSPKTAKQATTSGAAASADSHARRTKRPAKGAGTASTIESRSRERALERLDHRIERAPLGDGDDIPCGRAAGVVVHCEHDADVRRQRLERPRRPRCAGERLARVQEHHVHRAAAEELGEARGVVAVVDDEAVPSEQEARDAAEAAIAGADRDPNRPAVLLGPVDRLPIDEGEPFSKTEPSALAGTCFELDDGFRAAPEREAPRLEGVLDPDNLHVAVDEDGVDREAHEMRVDRRGRQIEPLAGLELVPPEQPARPLFRAVRHGAARCEQ